MKQLWNQFEVQAIKEIEGKTVIQITTECTRDEILRYATEQGLKGEIKFDDGRFISAEQRKKIFAMVKDISLFTGYEAEYTRGLLTLAFCYQNNIEPFSLSDCPLEVAREFITYLIEFCISQEIPLSETALERTDDISKYLFITLKHSVCCCCGDKGIIYTLDKDKNKMCLCEKHYDLAKLKGLEEFQKAFKIYGIKFIGGIVTVKQNL